MKLALTNRPLAVRPGEAAHQLEPAIPCRSAPRYNRPAPCCSFAHDKEPWQDDGGVRAQPGEQAAAPAPPPAAAWRQPPAGCLSGWPPQLYARQPHPPLHSFRRICSQQHCYLLPSPCRWAPTSTRPASPACARRAPACTSLGSGCCTRAAMAMTSWPCRWVDVCF